MPQFILDARERTALGCPVNGEGGFQSLARRLQQDLNQKTGEIAVSDDDVDRITKYCARYGQGGWQDRLWQAFHRVLNLDARI